LNYIDFSTVSRDAVTAVELAEAAYGKTDSRTMASVVRQLRDYGASQVNDGKQLRIDPTSNPIKVWSLNRKTYETNEQVRAEFLEGGKLCAFLCPEPCREPRAPVSRTWHVEARVSDLEGKVESLQAQLEELTAAVRAVRAVRAM
jgi:hypothetical protein